MIPLSEIIIWLTTQTEYYTFKHLNQNETVPHQWIPF